MLLGGGRDRRIRLAEDSGDIGHEDQDTAANRVVPRNRAESIAEIRSCNTHPLNTTSSTNATRH